MAYDAPSIAAVHGRLSRPAGRRWFLLDTTAVYRDLWNLLLRVLDIYYCALREGARGIAAAARLVAYDLSAFLASLGVRTALYEKSVGGLRVLVACPLEDCAGEPEVLHTDEGLRVRCCDATSYFIGRSYC